MADRLGEPAGQWRHLSRAATPSVQEEGQRARADLDPGMSPCEEGGEVGRGRAISLDGPVADRCRVNHVSKVTGGRYRPGHGTFIGVP
jgi:hypothetical protein